MKNFLNGVALFCFGLKMRIIFLFQALYCTWLYAAFWQFFVADLLLSVFYLLQNPYSVSRAYLQEKGAQNIHAYGETPLYLFEKACKRFKISRDKNFYELGSGRGKLCFWAANVYGFRHTVGIEENPVFYKRAEKVRRWLACKHMSFYCQDMRKIDYTGADLVYLYSTCMDPGFLRSLLAAFKSLKKGAFVISVSEPLKSPDFLLIDELSLHFPWGETKLFYQKKI